MKKIDLGQASTILANIGVIVGIIFLAYELRQNTLATEMVAAGNSTQYLREMGTLLAVNSDMADIVVKSLDGEEMSRVERMRMNIYFRDNLLGWMNIYDQYEKGVLSDELWNYYRSVISGGICTFTPARDLWMQDRDRYSAGFNQFVETEALSSCAR